MCAGGHADRSGKRLLTTQCGCPGVCLGYGKETAIGTTRVMRHRCCAWPSPPMAAQWPAAAVMPRSVSGTWTPGMKKKDSMPCPRGVECRVFAGWPHHYHWRLRLQRQPMGDRDGKLGWLDLIPALPPGGRRPTPRNNSNPCGTSSGGRRRNRAYDAVLTLSTGQKKPSHSCKAS